MTSHVDGRLGKGGLVSWSATANHGPVLVCVPWAGGGATPFRSWGLAISGVHAVRLPGRESRITEPALPDIASVVDEISCEVSRLGRRPLALFGHCSGAIVAFELARAMSSDVVQLFVASQLPPREAAVSAAEELSSGLDLARHLPAELAAEPALAELLKVAVAADMRVLAEYSYQVGAPLSIPVTAYHGADDPELTAEDLGGWSAETTGPFTVRNVPGADHLFNGAAWSSLAEHIAHELGSSAGSST